MPKIEGIVMIENTNVSKNSLISRMNPIDDIIKYPDGHN